MDHEEYKNEFKKLTDKMNEIVAKKNQDYAGGVDAFKNFRMCESLGICSVEAGVVVRISDKLTRISNLLDKDPAVTEESLIDTCIDGAAYLIILALIRKDKISKTSKKKAL